MGRSSVLLVCIASAAFSLAYSELDQGKVKRKSGSRRYEADKYDGDKYEAAKFDGEKNEADKYDTGKYDTGKYDADKYDTDKYDTGKYDTGKYENGKYDADKYDTDKYDTGKYDTGKYDADKYDTDKYDTGKYDTGKYDTGKYDTGKYDTNKYDTGKYDTNKYDTGKYDTGKHDTGKYDTNKYDTGKYDTDTREVNNYESDKYDSDNYESDKSYTEKRESASNKHRQKTEGRKHRLETTKLAEKDEKYKDEKNYVDYSNGFEKETDNGKKTNWAYDYDSVKGDYDVGDGDKYDVKKTSKDYGDYYLGQPKDTYETHSFNAPAQKTQDVTCSNGAKFLPHPSECTKFYQCAHSKPFLFTCPSGLYFNTALDVCDWPSNVDCTNGVSYDSGYKARHEPNQDQLHGINYRSNYDSGNQNNNQYNHRAASNSHTIILTPPDPLPLQPPPMYNNFDHYQKPTISRDYGMDFNSQKPRSVAYPMQSSYQPIVSPHYLPISSFHFPMIPVIQPTMYHQYVPVRSAHNQENDIQSNNRDVQEPEGGKVSKEIIIDLSRVGQEDTTSQVKKTVFDEETRAETEKVSTRQTMSSGDDENVGGQTIKKIFVRKSGAPSQRTDVSNKDRVDDTANKRFYYYYYQDETDNGDSKTPEQQLPKDNRKSPYDYLYLDTSSSNNINNNNNNNNNNNKYRRGKLTDAYDYDNKFYDDYGKSYDYEYDYANGRGRVKHVIAVDKGNRNKNDFNSHGKYMMNDNQVTDEELGYLHLDHRGRGTKKATKGKGGGLGDIGSLLPLLLLGGANGGANGGQQLLLTTLLLSSLKSNGNGGKGGLFGGGGGKSSSGGSKDKDDDGLLKKVLLLSLFSGNGNNNLPTVNVPNVQVVNGQFVNIATGAPAVVVDAVTGLAVTAAQASVNPTTGQLVVTATGNPVFLQDAAGNLQVAILGNTLTITGTPIQPVAVNRALARRLTQAGTGRFLPLGSIISAQSTPAPPTSPTSSRDAVNLIFLSPLTPSSLPPPIINNDGSATMIRGSLRDILGPNLSNFISNVPLVAGQGQPNSVAGNKQACSVVRSGETVPFRINPRGGRLLPSECDAIGKLLDKFVPTFLQNFVPSDAAFAGFGSNINNNNNNPQTNSAGGSNNLDISSSNSASDNNLFDGGSINNFINVKNDNNGCTIAVPNIVPQC